MWDLRMEDEDGGAVVDIACLSLCIKDRYTASQEAVHVRSGALREATQVIRLVQRRAPDKHGSPFSGQLEKRGQLAIVTQVQGCQR